MNTTIWTLLIVFVIAPLGALACDRSLFRNWIWHIAPEKVRDYEEHSGVTGKTPHQVARAGSLRGITDADMARHDVSNAEDGSNPSAHRQYRPGAQVAR